jgi:hypothetical protein
MLNSKNELILLTDLRALMKKSSDCSLSIFDTLKNKICHIPNNSTPMTLSQVMLIIRILYEAISIKEYIYSYKCCSLQMAAS